MHNEIVLDIGDVQDVEIHAALNAQGVDVVHTDRGDSWSHVQIRPLKNGQVAISVPTANYSRRSTHMDKEAVLALIGACEGSTGFLRMMCITEILGGGRHGAVKALGFVVAHDFMGKLDSALMEHEGSPGHKKRVLGSFESVEEVVQDEDWRWEYNLEDGDPTVAQAERERLAEDYERARRQFDFRHEEKDPLQDTLDGCERLAAKYSIPFDPSVLRHVTQAVIEAHTQWDMSIC